MKKILSTAAFCGVLALGLAVTDVAVSAQENVIKMKSNPNGSLNQTAKQDIASTANTLKIAVVDFDKVLSESHQYKDLQNTLRQAFSKRQTAIKAAEKQFKQSVENFNRKSELMKPQVRKKKADDIVAQRESLRKQYFDFHKAWYTAQKTGMNKLRNEIRAAVEKVSHQRGVDLVLDKRELAFFDPHYDITDAVSKIFNG